MTQSDYYEKRKEEMIELRERRGWSLQAIGDLYGISRERVRQVICGGVSKFHASKYKTFVRQNGYMPHVTDEKLSKMIGLKQNSIACARQDVFRNYRDYHRRVHYEAVMAVSKLLDKYNIEHNLKPTRKKIRPYNILACNGARIAVRATVKGVKSPSQPNSRWHLNSIRKSARNSDFVVLYLTSIQTAFVVPSKEMLYLKSNDLFFVYPTMRPTMSKWLEYKDRFDLIEEFDKEEK